MRRIDERKHVYWGQGNPQVLGQVRGLGLILHLRHQSLSLQTFGFRKRAWAMARRTMEFNKGQSQRRYLRQLRF